MAGDHYTLTSALSLRGRGFSVIPVRPDGSKRPAVKWEQYQEKVAEEQELRQWFKDGALWIGVVTGRISGICVVDIDTVEGEEALIHLFGKGFFDGPIVKSQSGGKHLYFAHPGNEDVRNRTRNIDGCDFRGDGGFVVVPPSPDYEWVQDLDEYILRPLPEEYISTALKSSTQVKKEGGKIKTASMFTEGRRDDDLFTVAHKLIRGGMPEQDVSIVLNQLAISWGEDVSDDTISKWLDTKVQSAVKFDQRKGGTLAKEVRNWVQEHTGWWKTDDCYRDLEVAGKNPKQAVRKELGRMVESGDVERDKRRSGFYRKLERVVEVIDFMSKEDDPLKLWLPFDLHELVLLHPGNIAILAGEPNAGKTAWMLNFIKNNMHNFGIDYYSSEMGKSELRMRLEKFEGITPSDWRFRAFERSSNFADIIDQNRISVIDYLEVLDEFYRVGEYISAIHEKLIGGKGIALIALQKKIGADMGRGAEFGLEKPRLYMAMGTKKDKDKNLIHTLKVIKAKNWAQEGVSPNNKEYEFKLAAGCRFIWDERSAISKFNF